MKKPIRLNALMLNASTVRWSSEFYFPSVNTRNFIWQEILVLSLVHTRSWSVCKNAFLYPHYLHPMFKKVRTLQISPIIRHIAHLWAIINMCRQCGYSFNRRLLNLRLPRKNTAKQHNGDDDVQGHPRTSYRLYPEPKLDSFSRFSTAWKQSVTCCATWSTWSQ